MIITEQNLIDLNEQKQVFVIVESGAIIQTSGGVELTQAQVEDSSSTVFGSVSGQRIWQAITAWGATAASIFSGILKGYKEQGTTLTVVAGVATVVHATCDNILVAPSATQDTLFNVQSPLTALKPLTIATPPDTGGPWTYSISVDGGIPVDFVRNGAGTALLETFEVWCDGTDLKVSEGLVWPTGASE